jgi:hypothetical protein
MQTPRLLSLLLNCFNALEGGEGADSIFVIEPYSSAYGDSFQGRFGGTNDVPRRYSCTWSEAAQGLGPDRIAITPQPP